MLVFPDTIGVPMEGREQLLLYAAATFNAFGPRNAIFERGNAAAVGCDRLGRQACKRDNLAPGGWGMAVYEAADEGACTAGRGGAAGPLLPVGGRGHDGQRHRPSGPGLRHLPRRMGQDPRPPRSGEARL